MTAAEWQHSEAIREWLEGKSLADLDILEHEGRVLYPDSIKKRDVKTQKLVEVPVRLRVPNTKEKVQARKAALKWAGSMLGDLAPSELTVGAVQARLGPNYWQHIDNICVLSLCVLEHKPPHGRYALPEVLDGMHEPAALYDLFDRLVWWSEQQDPRINEHLLTPEAVLTLAKAIARKGHTGPLLAIDGSARPSCVRIMAELLTNSPTSKSSSPSSETSTEG